VKEKRGRRRYIAFTVSAELTKETLISALRSVCSEPPYVIQCGEGWAIVRCSPAAAETTISRMRLADPSSSSLRTSGTLRTLRDLYPELKRLRPKKTV
jgi:RNase P/RNase MRP subunit POP5